MTGLQKLQVQYILLEPFQKLCLFKNILNGFKLRLNFLIILNFSPLTAVKAIKERATKTNFILEVQVIMTPMKELPKLL